MSHEITIKGGKSKKLLTGGKFCEHDIIVHAQGEIKLQSNKTVAPAAVRQTVLPDSGYDALENVTVEAVPQANPPTPTISVSSGGLITARSTQNTSGYVASGATAQATSQLTTQAAKTVTPSKSSQTAVAANRYTTGAVLVNPIPDSYVQPSGTLTITENGQHDVKSRAYVNVNVASSGGGGAEEQFIRAIERNSSNPITELPAGLTKIGDYAFYYFPSVAVASLPSGVTSIGKYAFSYCGGINWTSLPDGLTSIGNYAFRECRYLKLTSLPSSITSIGDSAFYYCTDLALTSLPNGLTSIPDSAFGECSDLELASLPSGVTDIGSSAFRGCQKLKLTSLPAGLISVGSSAFFNCTGLTRITFEGKPNSISSSAFSSCTNLRTINVPWAEGEVASAPWGAHKATINYNYTGG